MIAAVILSGGKSERMGSPKALLQYRGQTFLRIILDAVSAAGLEPVVVVAGHHHAAIAAAFPAANIVFNPNYEQGMSTSVQAGIRALPAAATGAGIFLVDHPLIDRETILTLSRQLKPGRIVLPVSGGRRGHPVFFAASLFSEILSLTPDLGLNTLVRRKHDHVLEIEVETPGVLTDIDTPEQFESLSARDQPRKNVS